MSHLIFNFCANWIIEYENLRVQILLDSKLDSNMSHLIFNFCAKWIIKYKN